MASTDLTYGKINSVHKEKIGVNDVWVGQLVQYSEEKELLKTKNGGPLLAPEGWYADVNKELLIEVKNEGGNLKAFIHGWWEKTDKEGKKTDGYKLITNWFSNAAEWLYKAAIHRYELSRDAVSYMTRKNVPAWQKLEKVYEQAKKGGVKETDNIIAAYQASLRIDESFSGSTNIVGDVVNKPKEVAGISGEALAGAVGGLSRGAAKVAGEAIKPMAKETVAVVKEAAKDTATGAVDVAAVAAKEITKATGSAVGAGNQKAATSFLGQTWDSLPTAGKFAVGGLAAGGVIWLGAKIIGAIGDASYRYNKGSEQNYRAQQANYQARSYARR